jgi:GAF domain-containing protein
LAQQKSVPISLRPQVLRYEPVSRLSPTTLRTRSGFAMNVILQGDGKPFGVLEVDSRSEEEFVAHDLAFLQGAANVLGMAIERRERQDRSLKAALARQQVSGKSVIGSRTVVASWRPELLIESRPLARRDHSGGARVWG